MRNCLPENESEYIVHKHIDHYHVGSNHTGHIYIGHNYICLKRSPNTNDTGLRMRQMQRNTRPAIPALYARLEGYQHCIPGWMRQMQRNTNACSDSCVHMRIVVHRSIGVNMCIAMRSQVSCLAAGSGLASTVRLSHAS